MKEIKLSQHRRVSNYKLNLVALVDDEDFENLNKLKWHALKGGNTFYARACINVNGKQKILRMHRLVLNVSKETIVDHRDGNGLNNQRYNLRTCTMTENTRNQNSRKGSSKFKGVTWNKREKAWRANITVDKKLIYLGRFKKEEDAARKYDESCIKYHGEFSNLNFKL